MKTYLQTGEILQWLSVRHRRLSQFYDACREKNNRGRAGLLLAHASQREQDLSEAIEAFKQNASEKILQTYFQYIPEGEDDTSDSTDNAVPEQLSPAQAVELIDRMSGRLENIYRKLAQMADYEKTREMLASVARKIQAEREATAEQQDHLSDI